VLNKIFVTKKDEVSNLVVVHNLYKSPNTVRILKLGWITIGWAWRKQGMQTEFWCGNLLQNVHLEYREWNRVL